MRPAESSRDTRATRIPAVACTGLALASLLAASAHGQSATGWGSNAFGQLSQPATLGAVRDISLGLAHTAALQVDGTVVCWGSNGYAQVSGVPAGLASVVAVDAGDNHTIALRGDGTVVCWGDNILGQATVPATLAPAVGVSAGELFSGALHADGSVTLWGWNASDGRRQAPADLGAVTRLELGMSFGSALRADGTVRCWGSFAPRVGPTVVLRDLAAGYGHLVGLRPDGTVEAWGGNSAGQSMPPVGLGGVVAVAAGRLHSLALKSDGSVVCWGSNARGQAPNPAPVTADGQQVAAGEECSYALTLAGGIAPPSVTLVSVTNAACGGDTGAIDATVVGATQIFWTGPSGFFRNATDLAGLAAGDYTITAIGRGGTATETVTILASDEAPVVASYDSSKSIAAGGNCTAGVPDCTASVVASDDCTATGDLVITQLPPAGTVVGLGEHDIAITVADATGHATTVHTTLTVTGLPVTCYLDLDRDGFGAGTGTTYCASVPDGCVTNNDDCDDTRLLYADTDGDGQGAGSPVACGVANNTDGCPDNANLFAPVTYFADVDGDGFGNAASTTSVCSTSAPTGYTTNSSDCNDNALLYADTDGDGRGAGSPVACGVANNTDGCPDNANLFAPVTYYADVDGDSFGNAASTTSVCETSAPTGYTTNPSDCNDNALLYADTDGDGQGAGSPVACGVANNTDGCPDNANLFAPVTYYADVDGDGFGNAASTTSVCSTSAPAGYTTNSSDCNDNVLLYADTDGDGRGAGSPVACGVANNTDGCPDNANLFAPVTYFADVDGDGFGNAASTTSVCSTSAPAGYTTDSSDCNDNALLYADTDGDGRGAGSPVACGVANNTDGCPDNANLFAPVTYYADVDGDGFGNAASTTSVCSTSAPAGYTTNSSDCNDNVLLYADTDGDGRGAGSPVACGVADNTDGCPDNANLFAPVTYYADIDGDGFGNAASTTSVCSTSAPTGYTTNSSDCNDNALLYADADADGFGAGSPVACGVASDTDCDDSDPTTFPGASEPCDGVDHNCNGIVEPDLDADGRLDCRDVELRMDYLDGVFAPGSTFVVRVSGVTLQQVFELIGLQAAVRFDAARLEFVGAMPVDKTPLPLEVAEISDTVAGTLRYALGAAPATTGFIDTAPLFDMSFRVREGAESCDPAALLVWFEEVDGVATTFATRDGSSLTPSLVSAPPADLDTVAPALDGVPAPIALATDAGDTFGAFVAEPAVGATDGCGDGQAIVTLAITFPAPFGTATAWPSDGRFPIGVSTLAWTATDDSGNSATETSTITVANHQLLDLDVQLVGRFTADVPGCGRTIRLTFRDGVLLVPVEFGASGTGGVERSARIAGVQVPVAASAPCVCVKDVTHSITDAVFPTIASTKYLGSVQLRQGDSNDDDVVDILDFASWLIDAGPAACNGRSNYNFDGLVNSADFSWVSVNFFARGEGCTGEFTGTEPMRRVSVKELRRRGLGALAAADLTGDGWLDERDIQVAASGAGTFGHASAENTTPGW